MKKITILLLLAVLLLSSPSFAAEKYLRVDDYIPPTPVNLTPYATDADLTSAIATQVAPNIQGKVLRSGTAVNDDDCTGEQGTWWWDSTDSAFEWCNANSGVPTVLGAGGSPICKTITNPNDADAFFLGINQRGAAWTLSEIRATALGGTSVVFTVQECDANGANCAASMDAKTITTGTAGTGTITDATVDDNDVLKIDIGTVTGAVTQLLACVE